MKKILVFAPHEDRAGRAAAVAGQLAAKTGAQIQLLRVLEEKMPMAADGEATEASRSVRQLLVDTETQQVEALAQDLRDNGISVSVEVCWGVAWEAVLDRVERDDVDLVVKPANGLERRGHVFFGATALHLFRKSPCPVWVVGDEGRLPTRLLAAIDPGEAVGRQEIASRILDWAEHISGWSNAEMHTGTAWNAFGADVLQERLTEDEWKEYADEAREQASSNLVRTLQDRAQLVDPNNVHLVQGVPHEVLPDLTRAQDIDLIIMGTLGREGSIGDHLGETAETMIREVRSSVLTIPPGVKSPAEE
ncbi:MAG: universal stress protein [Myxococcota bacterium]